MRNAVRDAARAVADAMRRANCADGDAAEEDEGADVEAGVNVAAAELRRDGELSKP